MRATFHQLWSTYFGVYWPVIFGATWLSRQVKGPYALQYVLSRTKFGPIRIWFGLQGKRPLILLWCRLCSPKADSFFWILPGLWDIVPFWNYSTFWIIISTSPSIWILYTYKSPTLFWGFLWGSSPGLSVSPRSFVAGLIEAIGV